MGLGSLAVWCVRRRRLVVGLWLLALVALGVGALTLQGEYTEIRDIPPGQGKTAYELLQKRFPIAAGDNADVVFEAERGVNDPAVQARMTAAFEEIGRIPSVLIVQSPYGGGGRISPDGRIGDALVQFKFAGRETPIGDAKRVIEIVNRANEPGLTVAVTGPGIEKAVRPKPPASEAIGVFFAMIILLIAFGSVVAMGVPIATALFGLGAGLASLTILASAIDVPNVAPQLAAMIGLGVGIDYALFIVTRYRQEMERGLDVEDAIRLSLMTAGRAVIFAAFTVVISMLGMFLMGLPFARGLATGAIVAVFTVMIASITLLPAVLGFAGRNIDRLKVPGLGRKSEDGSVTAWYRWSRFVQRYPWPTALVGLVIVLALAWPTLSIQLGLSDNGSVPKGQITRAGYDLLTRGFGPGLNGRLIIVAPINAPDEFNDMERVREAIAATPGIVEVGPVIRGTGGPNGDAALVVAVPEHSPQDQRTSDLVRELRARVIPAATSGTTLRPQVGGFTAVGVDFSDYLGARLPLFIGAVLALSFLLLMVVFRSILVPLKAVIMNVLSIAAAYGVVVAVFQWGWLGGLVGIDRTGPIEIFVPMLLFAILFGLSMDYEVFLLSRVREEWDGSGDNGEAVADGLAATARVITAAAAIMIFVFIAFVLDSNRVIKIFGLGLASAIFIDATLVRMVLVPATMELLGSANWWLPKWLDRILPHLNIEQADIGDLDAEAELEREHAAELAASVEDER